MNVDAIPESMKRVMADNSLTMNQKLVTFMAFMPNLPDDPKVEQYCKDNIEVWVKIKRLFDEKKIRLGNIDKNFKWDLSQPKTM